MFPVKHVRIKPGIGFGKLIRELSSSAFGAKRLAKACEILERMIIDRRCKRFLGVAGAMVPAGMRSIIGDILKLGYFDVLVTTGANLTHDLVEAWGGKHYLGDERVDDIKLKQMGIDRIYDIYMPDEVYESLEDNLKKILESLPAGKIGIKELLWEIGKKVRDKNSILRICFKERIPIFCPALEDSGIGEQIAIHLPPQVKVLAFRDIKEIIDICFQAPKVGCLLVGGGVPKNYILQAFQFSKGASYAVQITTDRPEFGGLSGAELREALSWGKLAKKASFVDLICDATIALPLILAYLRERLG
jgi:deoxyhypusine synthase